MNIQTFSNQNKVVQFNYSKFKNNIDSPKMLFPPNVPFSGNLLKPNQIPFNSKNNKCNSTRSSINNKKMPQTNVEQLLPQIETRKLLKSKTAYCLHQQNKFMFANKFQQKKQANRFQFLPVENNKVIDDKKRQDFGFNQQIYMGKRNKDKFLSQNNSLSSKEDIFLREKECSQMSKSFKNSQKSDKSQRSQNILKNTNILYVKENNRERPRSMNRQKSAKTFRQKIPKFIQEKSKKITKQICSENDPLSSNNIAPAVNNQQEESVCFDFKINVKPAIKKRSIFDFLLLRQIGKGSSGRAVLALQKNIGFICVLKILQKANFCQTEINQLIRQIKIQGFLQSKSLTSLYGYFADDDNIYEVLQLLPSGNLYNLMINTPKMSQHKISNYVYQICNGIKYMHDNNVLHRDIKPQNIFLFENMLKLGDFGCAVYSEPSDFRTSLVGSPCYLSPQQLCRGQYDKKVDIWQIGILTYEFFFKRSPYEVDICHMLKQHNLNSNLSELKFPWHIKLSQQAKSFITKALMKNPKERMSIDEALNHPFIKNCKEQL